MSLFVGRLPTLASSWAPLSLPRSGFEWIYNPSMGCSHLVSHLASAMRYPWPINSYFMACSAVIRREGNELKREKQSKLLIKENQAESQAQLEESPGPEIEPREATHTHNRRYSRCPPPPASRVASKVSFSIFLPLLNGFVFMRFQSMAQKNSNNSRNNSDMAALGETKQTSKELSL